MMKTTLVLVIIIMLGEASPLPPILLHWQLWVNNDHINTMAKAKKEIAGDASTIMANRIDAAKAYKAEDDDQTTFPWVEYVDTPIGKAKVVHVGSLMHPEWPFEEDLGTIKNHEVGVIYSKSAVHSARLEKDGDAITGTGTN